MSFDNIGFFYLNFVEFMRIFVRFRMSLHWLLRHVQDIRIYYFKGIIEKMYGKKNDLQKAIRRPTPMIKNFLCCVIKEINL